VFDFFFDAIENLIELVRSHLHRSCNRFEWLDG
jgi:hypothetical protein